MYGIFFCFPFCFRIHGFFLSLSPCRLYSWTLLFFFFYVNFGFVFLSAAGRYACPYQSIAVYCVSIHHSDLLQACIVQGDCRLDYDIAGTSTSKKCIILSVSGLLCYISPNIPTDRWNAHRNVIKRPGVTKLFAMLLERFHVGLWCTMPMRDLKPLLSYILPSGVIDRLSFVYGREFCDRPMNFPWCYKLLKTLYCKRRSREVCRPDQLLLVDVSPLALRLAPDAACYMPYPFRGDLSSSSTTIPNVATDILPFIYPLYQFESVSQYMSLSNRPGQLHYEVAHSLKYGVPLRSHCS